MRTAHPDYTVSALVRSESAAEEVKKQYPEIKIVLGGLDDVEKIEAEAKESDVVLSELCDTSSWKHTD